VGVLDASVLVGFPSTVASTWQRAGRAGRSGDESLAVVIAYNEPIDQYLVRRPGDTLDKCPEHAVVDLHNPYILASQLSCAAAELPLVAGDVAYFGDSYEAVAGALEDDDRLKKIDAAWYWASSDFPAAKVNLRNMSDDTVTIMDVTRENEVIGQVDSISAPELVYPEAIYLHEGRTYYVRELDLEQQVAFVEPRNVDYYTQAIVDDRIRVDRPHDRATLNQETLGYGELDVHWATVAFKKIQFYHLDSIGFHALDLPYQELHTTGFWYSPSPAAAGYLKRDGLSTREGLAGLRNVLSHLVPRTVMCDRQDLGTSIEASNTGLPTLFVYDRYPGGIGFAEKAFTLLPEVLERGRDLVSSCPCRTGCPSCVGVPPLDPGVHDDPEVRLRPSIPGKAATLRLLEAFTRGG
jgi:DEAD/DEAH box helicase domain-containing protein